MPQRNRTLWAEKFRRNRERDLRAIVALRSLRYATLVIWECELRDPARLSSRMERFFTLLGR
jgi:DNA mismatch endonuclease (patch repair protein)